MLFFKDSELLFGSAELPRMPEPLLLGWCMLESLLLGCFWVAFGSRAVGEPWPLVSFIDFEDGAFPLVSFIDFEDGVEPCPLVSFIDFEDGVLLRPLVVAALF